MMFEAQRKNIDQRIDDLAYTAYDAGWNAAVDIFNAAIKEKESENDQTAVAVLRWALQKLGDE